MPTDFLPLAERVVDAVLDQDPELAAAAGDHRADDRLPDRSAAAAETDAAMFRSAADALSQVDLSTLTPDLLVDHAVLMSRVERSLFELTTVREREWNPLVHNPAGLIHNLLVRPFPPAEQRLIALGSRLAALPDALATARAVLRDCPTVHLATAVEQFAGLATLVRDGVPPLLTEVPGLRATVQPRQQRALVEIDAFGAWLRDRLRDRLPDRGGRADGDRFAGSAGIDMAGEDGRSPRLGRALWEARLWHELDSELPAARIAQLAEAMLETTTEQLREAAAELTGGRADDGTVRRALDLLSRDRTDGPGVVALATTALAQATRYVRDHDLVWVPDDPCLVLEMPEYARGVAVAYCDPPGALEHPGVPTRFCVAPAPAHWPAERVDSFYREYNDHLVRNLTVHEAMPGHHLQFAHARRLFAGMGGASHTSDPGHSARTTPPPSRTTTPDNTRARGLTRARALGFSGSFVEGWASYAEEMMTSHGFGGLPVRIQQLKMRLRLSINAMLDRGVHCDAMTEGDAMALMTERGFMEPAEAAGKWRRALLTSTQLSTYLVGLTEVSAIAASRPPQVRLRDWHDAMLSHGSPPPRHVLALLQSDAAAGQAG